MVKGAKHMITLTREEAQNVLNLLILWLDE